MDVLRYFSNKLRLGSCESGTICGPILSPCRVDASQDLGKEEVKMIEPPFPPVFDIDRLCSWRRARVNSFLRWGKKREEAVSTEYQ